MKHLVRVALAALMLWTLATPFAEASPDEVTIRLAKSYYEKGDAAYNLSRFEEAVGWFTKAYETWPLPDFLYNIAQSYRQAGNCKQALFAYRRYLSLKDKDNDSPLTRKEHAEIERFIKDLTVCVANAESSAAVSPGALKGTPIPPATTTQPVADPTSTSTTLPPTTTPASTSSSTRPRLPPTTTTAVTVEPEAKDEDEDEASVSRSTAVAPKLLSAYATGGIAIIGTGGALDVPVQPSFAVGGGYPVPAGPVTLDLGARASFSPIQYDTMDATERASLLGVRATLGATYRVSGKISVRGDLGLGIAMLRGLVEGNPFTDSGQPGAFTMLSFRVGVAAEYAITSNISATIAPLSLGFSPVPDELSISSLTELDVLFGVGYRM